MSVLPPTGSTTRSSARRRIASALRRARSATTLINEPALKLDPETVLDSPPSASEPECSPVEDGSTCDPGAARLREVLGMVAVHTSQEEIAERFGVTTRTVRNWIKRAKEQRLHTFKSIQPEEMLARTDHLHATLEAKLRKRLEIAEAADKDRELVEIIREIRAIERDRYAIRSKIGFFDGYRFEKPMPQAPGEQDAREMRAFAQAFMVMAGKGEEIGISLKPDDQSNDTDQADPPEDLY